MHGKFLACLFDDALTALLLADQERVLAENLSKAAQAETERDLNIKQAEYAATAAQQKAQADRAYDIQASITRERLVEEASQGRAHSENRSNQKEPAVDRDRTHGALSEKAGSPSSPESGHSK